MRPKFLPHFSEHGNVPIKLPPGDTRWLKYLTGCRFAPNSWESYCSEGMANINVFGLLSVRLSILLDVLR